MSALHCAVVIPTYNNSGTILRVLRDVQNYAADVFVVDDGSTDATAELLRGMEGVTRLGYAKNRGKGYALRTAIAELAKRGFRYMLAIDADGQHYADDIPSFVAAAEREPDTLFIGARCLTAENMPSKNTFANKFSNFWYRFETGHELDDTQSGFRLYPLAKLSRMHFFTSRYEFEVEVIVRASWSDVPVKNIPIKVYYPPQEERVSHFRPGKDFTRISILNTCLVVWALLVYYPILCLRWLSWSHIKSFFRDHVLSAPDSNHRMAASVAWGVMWGVLPVWGWQGVAAVATGHLFRLNKVVTFLSSNVSIPPMIPFIVFGSYALGCMLMGEELILSLEDITFESVGGSLLQYVAGSVVLAAILAGVTYVACRMLFWMFQRKR